LRSGVVRRHPAQRAIAQLRREGRVTVRDDVVFRKELPHNLNRARSLAFTCMKIRAGDVVRIKGGTTCMVVVEAKANRALCKYAPPGVEAIVKWIEASMLERVGGEDGARHLACHKDPLD
jgi:hypothetical protein